MITKIENNACANWQKSHFYEALEQLIHAHKKWTIDKINLEEVEEVKPNGIN